MRRKIAKIDIQRLSTHGLQKGVGFGQGWGRCSCPKQEFQRIHWWQGRKGILPEI